MERSETLLRTQARLAVKRGDWKSARTAWLVLVERNLHKPQDFSAISNVCWATADHSLYQRATGLEEISNTVGASFPENKSMTNAVRFIELAQYPAVTTCRLVEKTFVNTDNYLLKNITFYEDYSASLQGAIPALEMVRESPEFTALYFQYIGSVSVKEPEAIIQKVIEFQHGLAALALGKTTDLDFPRLVSVRLSKFTSRYRLCYWRLLREDRETLSLLKQFTDRWPIYKEAFCSLPRLVSHGDFRTRNVLVTQDEEATGSFRIVTIDWDNWGYAPFGTDLAFYLRDSLLAGSVTGLRKYLSMVSSSLSSSQNKNEAIFSVLFIVIIDHVYRIGRKKHRLFPEEIEALKSALILSEEIAMETRHAPPQ